LLSELIDILIDRFFVSLLLVAISTYWFFSWMFVRQECDICSGMCCNLLSFTIDIVIRDRPVDMHVILNFLKNEGNLHCLGVYYTVKDQRVQYDIDSKWVLNRKQNLHFLHLNNLCHLTLYLVTL
jgi:hypothetical protein